MKKLFLLLLFIGYCFSALAQKQYTIKGETLELKTEVSGTIDLLWNIIEKEYRYFIKKDGTITELINTKGDTNKFLDQYKTTLSNFTNGSQLNTDKIKLTLYSLTNFVNDYNATQDPNYEIVSKDVIVNSRLLIFGGVTNSPFIENINNTSNPQFGLEIEVFEGVNTPRHSLIFEIKHVLDSDEFKYSTTQLSLGYRYRFVKTETFNLYATIFAATYNFSKNTNTFNNEGDETITSELTNNVFDAPFTFGLGADLRVTTNSFITLNYNELFAIFLDSPNNFSTNITLGYKFNL